MTTEPSTLTGALRVAEGPYDRCARISWFDYGSLNGRKRRNIAVRERSIEGPRSTSLRPFGPELKTFGKFA